MNQLHITPRQNTYAVLCKLKKAEQNDLRNGIYKAVMNLYDKEMLQWNNDQTLDFDFRLLSGRFVTVMVYTLLNAEDGDIHCRIDHILIHDNEKAANNFAEDREKQKGTFNKVL